MHPLNKESNIRNSIKKFFLDGINAVEGIPVHFTTNIDQSELSEWIFVDCSNESMTGHVSRKRVIVYVFTRDDPEYDRLHEIMDKVISYFHPGHIALYDGDWNEVGGAKVEVLPVGALRKTKDNSNFKAMPFVIAWGASW